MCSHYVLIGENIKRRKVYSILFFGKKQDQDQDHKQRERIG